MKTIYGRLLTVENAKTVKGEKLGYLTGILYMTPARAPSIDGANLCKYSTAGCRAGCLVTAGRGGFDSVAAGRARKRALWLQDPHGFILQLEKEIKALELRARRAGLRAVVRLNGTTDIEWETAAPGLFEKFPRVQFYDYTKDPRRAIGAPLTMGANAAPRIPRARNYDLTYSRAENRDAAAMGVLAAGGRVAVVFSTKRGRPLPRTWKGYPVKDGDRHDLRFLERAGVVGLRAKGKAKKDTSGFVVDAGALEDPHAVRYACN
jgi:hypothetical protein